MEDEKRDKTGEVQGTHAETVERDELPPEAEETYLAYLRDFELQPEELHVPLLDVGAGLGHFIRYVRSRLGNKEAFGVELDAERVGAGTGDGMVRADINKLPFPPESFSLVLAREIMTMFLRDNPMIPIRELMRVVKPGGRILFDVMTEGTLDYYKRFDAGTKEDQQGEDERITSRRRLVRELDMYGRGGQFSVEHRNDGVIVITKLK